MTIKTLEYIHKLLKDENQKLDKLYTAASKLAPDDSIEDDNLSEIIRMRFAAIAALNDFEDTEW